MSSFLGQRRASHVVYFIGVMALGLMYYPAKGKIGDAWFIVTCVIYLLALRLVGVWIEQRLNN